MNIKWYNCCWSPWPNWKRRGGGNLSKHQGSLCACANFPPPPFVSNAKRGVLTLKVSFSWIKKWKLNQCGYLLRSARATSCTCALQRLWECAQGSREWSTERDREQVSNGAVLWRGQREGALLHTKANKWYYLGRQWGKQIYFFFLISNKTLIHRNIYTENREVDNWYWEVVCKWLTTEAVTFWNHVIFFLSGWAVTHCSQTLWMNVYPVINYYLFFFCLTPGVGLYKLQIVRIWFAFSATDSGNDQKNSLNKYRW